MTDDSLECMMQASRAECRFREILCSPAESTKQQHGHGVCLFSGEGM